LGIQKYWKFGMWNFKSHECESKSCEVREIKELKERGKWERKGEISRK
jgi:hypothetical protein